jgi:hypothetical protein
MVIAKLAEKVLSKVGVYDRNATDPADLQNIVDAYAAVYLVLKDDGLVTWAYSASDEADIPDRFSLSLIDLIKAEVADFYAFTEPAIGWDRFRLNATNKIRRQLANSQPTETVQAEYF